MIKDEIVKVIHSYTDPFPKFEEQNVLDMAEQIQFVVMQTIATALNNAMGVVAE